MTDLVKRLRRLAIEHYEMLGDIHEPLNEAADEIERLEKVNYALRHPYDAQKALIDDMRAWRMVKRTPVFGEREICSPKRDSIILFDPELLNAYAKDRGIE